jgi:c-di-GMP-binding flagellar brake protein YcgR
VTRPLSETLTIGRRLEIKAAGDSAEWLPSRLEDSDGDTLMTVAWPTDRFRRLLPVSPGDTIEVSVTTPEAVYSARMAVQSASRDGVPLLKLQVSGAWRRTQRRNAVRTTVAIRPRIADAIYGHSRKKLRLGITNLSATGVRVRSQDELRCGDLLHLAFELMGMEEELELLARVRRVHQFERVWDAGCEFEALPEKAAQRIVQFIFMQQRASAQARRRPR